MKHTLLRSIAAMTAVAALLTPTSAIAYLSPEQVFGGQNLAPPLQREGLDVQKVQQQRSAEFRQEAQAQLKPEFGIEPVDTYVAPEPAKRPSMLSNENNYEARMQRIEEKKASSPTIIVGGGSAVIDAQGNVLHSGAPLVTETGPATTLALIAIVLASISTFAYVQLQSRRVAQM